MSSALFAPRFERSSSLPEDQYGYAREDQSHGSHPRYDVQQPPADELSKPDITLRSRTDKKPETEKGQGDLADAEQSTDEVHPEASAVPQSQAKSQRAAEGQDEPRPISVGHPELRIQRLSEMTGSEKEEQGTTACHRSERQSEQQSTFRLIHGSSCLP